MALPKTVVPISLSQGLDTKQDPKQVVMGKLLYLQNAFFKNINRIIKRFGFVALAQSIFGGGSISNAIGLTTFKNELVELDGANLYSYSPGLSQWAKPGQVFNCRINATPVVRNTNQQTTQDSTRNGSFGLFAWEDSSGGIRYSVFDNTTNLAIVDNAVLAANGVKPKTLSIGNYMVTVYYDTTLTHLMYFAVNATTLATSSGTLASDIKTTSFIYDGTVINGILVFAYNNASNGITLNTLSATLGLGTSHAVSGDAATTCLTIYGDTSFNNWVTYYNGTALKTFILSSTYTTVHAVTVIDTLASVRNVTGIVSGTQATIYYEIPGTQTYFTYIKTNTFTTAGAVGTAAVWIRSLGLASKAFSQGGVFYVMTAYQSPLQPTYFVLNASAIAVAKISPSVGGGLTAKSILPEVNVVSTNIWQVSYLQQDYVTAVSGQVYFQIGVMTSNLDFSQVGISTLELGSNLHLPGGVLTAYDGGSVNEHNFHYYPEGLTNNFNTIGGALDEKQYQYAACYEWTDNQGQIHRSAPSVAQTVNLNPTTATTGFTFVGSLTSGSNAMSISGNPVNIALGQIISGPGLPAGTVVTATEVGQITLSNNATANETTQTYLVTPSYLFQGTTQQASNVMSVLPIPFIMAVAQTISTASTTIPLNTVTGLSVGMTCSWLNGFFSFNPLSPSNVTTITAINGNTITVSANPAASGTNVVLYFSNSFVGTVNGTTTVTGVPTGAFSLMTVGSYLYSLETGNNTPYIVQTLTPGSNTLTVNNPISQVGPATNIQLGIGVNGVYQLAVGQTIVDSTGGTTLGPNTQITAISVANQTVTLSNAALSSQTGINFTTTTVFTVLVTIPTLRLTQKTNVSVVIYRTAGNLTTFYRVTSVSSLLFNSTSADTVSFFDNTSDYVLVGNEQLYTTGGVLENGAAPATNIQVSFKNRDVIIPSENPLTWWPSQQTIPGTPVQFSPFLAQNIDPRGGNITGLGVMDEKLVFFKPTGIFYVVGEGPNSAGGNNDYTEPILIPTDAGSTNQKSIILTPLGLMFQTPSKGIYLLDRSLNVSYVGGDVEAYNGITVTSAQLITSLNQVRFTLTSGVQLVFDYFVKQWSVFTNIAAVDACIFQNQFTYVQSGGLVQQESTSLYTDNGSFIPISLITSWLSFAGLQGFQRVYKFLVLGDWYSAHTLQIQSFSDFQNTPDDTTSIPVLTAPSGAYQYRVNMLKQKCETVQLQITEQQASSFGQGLDLSNLAFEVGLKKGTNKIGATRSFT